MATGNSVSASTIIYTDKEHLTQSSLEMLLADCGISSGEVVKWFINEDAVLGAINGNFTFEKLPCKRNYASFRKELDEFLFKLFQSQSDYSINGLRLKTDVYTVMRYRLLFDFEDTFHKYWVWKRICKHSGSRLILQYTAKNAEEMALLLSFKAELAKREENITLHIDNPNNHNPINKSLLKEWLYEVKRAVSPSSQAKAPKAKKYKRVFLENYANGTKLANSILDKINVAKESVLFVYVNQSIENQIHNGVDRVYAGGVSMPGRFTVLSEFIKHRSGFSKQLEFEFMRTSFFKLYYRALMELLDLKQNFEYIRKTYQPEIMISSNYSGMFSRLWCQLFKDQTYNIYTQHGLLVRYPYLNHFAQDELWLWGESFSGYIAEPQRHKIKVVGRIPEKKQGAETIELPDGRINILYLASRKGGAVVSDGLSEYMLNYLINELKGMEDEVHLWVRPHPADAESSFFTDYSDQYNIMSMALDGNADEWIEKCDICIVASSTTVMDVSKQGKLLGLFRNFPNHDAAFEFEKYDEVLFLDREGDLKKIIVLLQNRDNIKVGKLSADYAANFKPAQMQEHLLN